MKINVCSEASSIYRSESKEIFEGFGLSHNQIIDELLPVMELPPGGMVLIAQTIAEAIILFGENLQDIINAGNDSGDIRWDDENSTIYLELNVPRKWRENGIINSKVYFYRAVLEEGRMNICAYDEVGKAIPANIEFPKQFSKFLPMVAVIIASDMIKNDSINKTLMDFAKKPSDINLAKIYVSFYKRHRPQVYDVSYEIITTGQFKDFNSLRQYYNNELKPLKEDIISENSGSKETDFQFPKGTFKDEYLDLIPKLGKEYIFPENLLSLSKAVSSGDIRSVLLHGPAGTGKTMSCKLIAQLINMPIMDTVNCTENLDEFVLGKYIPEGNSIVFKESYVTKAIREGGTVVFEEINFAKPQYLAFLNSLLDDNGFVRLDNGELIKRNKNFRFFATMNIGYFGTKELNQALYNRFQAIVEIRELSDIAIRTMLVERVPECAGFVDDAISLYHKIKDKIRREELDIVISPRNLENWMKMCKYEPLEDAAEKTIIPIARGDKDLEIDLKLMIKQCKWR